MTEELNDIALGQITLALVNFHITFNLNVPIFR